MDYEKMWKEMKNQYIQVKKELEDKDWGDSTSWQVANYTLEVMIEIENENK